MMMSQILRSVYFTKTQKSRYLGWEPNIFFSSNKKNHNLYIKSYFIAKNSFVAEVTFKSILHAILESNLNYLLPVLAQNANSIKRLLVLQKKSLQIMHFLIRNTHTSNLFKHLNILKLPDKASLENCILICKCFNQSLPKTFKN